MFCKFMGVQGTMESFMVQGPEITVLHALSPGYMPRRVIVPGEMQVRLGQMLR